MASATGGKTVEQAFWQFIALVADHNLWL